LASQSFQLPGQSLNRWGASRSFPTGRTSRFFTPHPFDFCALEVGSGQRDLVQLWETRLGQPLFPLGQGFGNMTMLVAGDGRVLAGETDTLHLIGKDIDEALEVLISARPRADGDCVTGSPIVPASDSLTMSGDRRRHSVSPLE